MSTVPATLSWKPRWSESHTSAGTTITSRIVRTTGRQSPTRPPADRHEVHSAQAMADAAADGRDEDDLHDREDPERGPRVRDRAVRREEHGDEEGDRPIDCERADPAAGPSHRPPTGIRGEAETLPPANCSVRDRRRWSVSRLAPVDPTDCRLCNTAETIASLGGETAHQ